MSLNFSVAEGLGVVGAAALGGFVPDALAGLLGFADFLAMIWSSDCLERSERVA